MKYFYMVSYLIFQRRELIKTGVYLTASLTSLNIRQLHEKVVKFCGNGMSDIEVSLVTTQKISEEDYRSYLPDGMTAAISPEFDSHTTP